MLEDLPVSIEAAVRVLLALVPKSEQARIVAMVQDDLIALHFGLGQWIRNYFRLWKDNPQLLAAIGKHDPDEASGVIVLEFWKRLRDDLPKLH